MVNSNLPLHNKTDQVVGEADVNKLAGRRSSDFKVLVPNVDQICKEDRMHLLLDMPGLDESSCEIELIPGRVTIRGRVNTLATSYEVGDYSNCRRNLLAQLSNDDLQRFQYCFEIPVDYENLHYAQFTEGTLHICVDRNNICENSSEKLKTVN